MIAEEISKDVPVSLKRGCSEYAVAYPEYAQTGQDTADMVYRYEGQAHEDRADKEWVVMNTQHPANPVYEHQTYTLRDALVMFTWLKYAASIVDDSFFENLLETITILEHRAPLPVPSCRELLKEPI